MSKKWGYQEAREFLRRRLGLSTKDATDTLAALRDYILLAFLSGAEVSIPKVCTIHVKEVKGNTESGKVLRGFLKISTSAKALFSKYLDNSQAEEVQEMLTKKTPRSRLDNPQFKELRGVNKLTPVLFKPNEVRDHFLHYLQHEFPYRDDWEHPISKRVHEHSLILKIIEDYKYIQPTSYKAFWGLWMGVENQRILQATGGKQDQLPLRWQHAIDYIVLMLEYPQLVSAVEELIPLRYGGNDDKDIPNVEE